MKATFVVILAGMLAGPVSALYAKGGAQATSSASSSATVEADKSGASASSNNSASTSANAGRSSASLSGGTAMNATLSQPVDAKKNKSGDQITAKTTEATKSEGKVVIPKGSKVVGHVTECKQRTKEEKESAIGIVFERAILRNGEEIPLNVTIRALAAAQSAATSSTSEDDVSAGAGAGRASSGGALSSMRSTAGGAAGAVTNTAATVGGAAGGAVNSTVNAAGASRGAIGGLNAAGQLTSNSQGVFGLQGLNLNAVTSNTTQGSLITSTSKNVHLDSGTQLLLVSQVQASTAAPKQ